MNRLGRTEGFAKSVRFAFPRSITASKARILRASQSRSARTRSKARRRWAFIRRASGNRFLGLEANALSMTWATGLGTCELRSRIGTVSESRIPENDSRPLPPDFTKKYLAGCLHEDPQCETPRELEDSGASACDSLSRSQADGPIARRRHRKPSHAAERSALGGVHRWRASIAVATPDTLDLFQIRRSWRHGFDNHFCRW